MTQHYYALILAGGGGTRLWPMSRQDKPKQMLPLIDERTMFRLSIDRLAPLFTPDRVYVVTGTRHVDALRAEAPDIPAENFIVEPSGQNTAPAAGLGIWVISQRDPQATIVLLTADHFIADEAGFRNVLEAAHTVAQDGYIVTLGIAPSHPSTGFGYIRQGDEICKVSDFVCYHTRGFTEKPNIVAATSFVASGNYSWNSGMFIWTAARAREEYEHQQAAMFQLFEELAPTIDKPDFQEALDNIWPRMTSTSIDFAIMEGAKQMAVIPTDIGWSDIGDWSSLFDVHKLDRFGNVFKGHAPERFSLDTEKTMIYSDRLTVTIGVEDLIVIDTEDALLICHRSRAQEVRDVVNHLRSINRDEYL